MIAKSIIYISALMLFIFVTTPSIRADSTEGVTQNQTSQNEIVRTEAPSFQSVGAEIAHSEILSPVILRSPASFNFIAAAQVSIEKQRQAIGPVAKKKTLR